MTILFHIHLPAYTYLPSHLNRQNMKISKEGCLNDNQLSYLVVCSNIQLYNTTINIFLEEFDLMKNRDKHNQQKNHNLPAFSLRFDKLQSPKRFQLQLLNNAQQRIVMPRPHNSKPFKETNQGMVKSLDISQHHIEIEQPKQVNIQFSKKLKCSPKAYGHGRTCSHQCRQYQQEGQDQILSDFSNSLQNISSQIIEIPFANRTITQKTENTGLKQSKNRMTLLFSRKNTNSLRGSMDKLKAGSQELRRHVKKISYSKQNFKTSAKNQQSKLQVNMIPKPKKEGHILNKVSLSDFSLKAVKITRSGSIIYMAIHNNSGCIYALKSIRKSKAKLKMNQLILQLKLGLFANHPNITKTYGFFEEGDNFYLIKEYLQQGSLADEQKGLPQAMITQYINQVIFGVMKISSLVDLEYWHITPFQLAKSHGIIKITNLQFAQKTSSEIFSQQFKKTVEFFFESDRRSTFQGSGNENSESRNSLNTKLSVSFFSLLQKILFINQSTLHLLWQHAFLKQSRFKAIMQE